RLPAISRPKSIWVGLRPVSYPGAHGGQTLSWFLGCLRCLSSRPRGRDPRPPSPARRPQTLASRSIAPHVLGPRSLGLPPPSLDRLVALRGSGQPPYRDLLAPPPLSPLLCPPVA